MDYDRLSTTWGFKINEHMEDVEDMLDMLKEAVAIAESCGEPLTTTTRVKLLHELKGVLRWGQYIIRDIEQEIDALFEGVMSNIEDGDK